MKPLNTPLTPDEKAWATKELKHFKAIARMEARNLRSPTYEREFRSLAECNLKEANRMIVHYMLTLKYGNFNFPPPSTSIANWDFNSWDKYLSSVGNVPLEQLGNPTQLELFPMD